jgi:HB1, ASXL, restriction endonuclease HTH domain
MAARTKLTAREAITKVLAQHGGAMKVPEIIKAAVPLTGLAGKTPGQTIYSVLYAEAKKPGSVFKQTGRGEFRLDKAAVAKAEKAASGKQTMKQEEQVASA